MSMSDASAVIHVVDDDASFRLAMSRVLSASGFQVALYESAQQLLDAPPAGKAGCILLDVEMSGLSGPQLQERLTERGNRLPIIFLTGHGDIPTSVRTIKAGAQDFLTKPVPRLQLLDTIRCALDRYEKLQAQDLRASALRSRVARLTPREREVFELVVRGRLNKQIAHDLGTSERTIKAHRHQVMEKCEVKSLAELVITAERIGIVPASEGGDLAIQKVKAGD
jgi:FixJ family two-component response regulator